jgi:hypothetical protein
VINLVIDNYAQVSSFLSLSLSRSLSLSLARSLSLTHQHTHTFRERVAVFFFFGVLLCVRQISFVFARRGFQRLFNVCSSLQLFFYFSCLDQWFVVVPVAF